MKHYGNYYAGEIKVSAVKSAGTDKLFWMR